MIDPRIALAGQVPSLAPAINIFENALMNAQTRGLRQSQEQRAQALAPFQLQQAQQGLDIGQQALTRGQQAITAGDVAAETAQENRVLRSVAEFGTKLKPILEAGNDLQALTMLDRRLGELESQGLPTEETQEAIAQIQGGNSRGVIDSIDSISQIAQQRGLGGTTQQTRVTSSKILDDGTTVQSLSTGGTNVISPSGQLLEGNARTDALNKALQVKISQKEKAAQVVSDVNIAEVVELETASTETAQNIESKRINIDETKFKNSVQRDQVINAKNARRKEADAAIIQIDDLIKNDRFSNAFGKLVTATPELLRSQESIDAIADVNQIKGLITLESRQKLKGQGTITDSEQKILAQSATVLDNPLISDERARRELRKIKRVFEDASDRNQLKRETKDRIEVEAATVARGEGQIMTDANGNRARVFADGTFEEL